MTRTDAAPPSERRGGGGIDGFTREELHDFLREMLLYRRFEEKAEEAYAIGKIGGFCHLHIGQEAVALGFIGPLRTDDYAISAYREHTQALAKGVSPRGVMAEPCSACPAPPNHKARRSLSEASRSLCHPEQSPTFAVCGLSTRRSDSRQK